MSSLMKNHTWDLVRLPKKQMMVGYNWIFKTKEVVPWLEESRFKERLVAKSFTQVDEIDYDAIFLLILKHYSIRVIMTIVNQYNLDLEKMDVKTFLTLRP